MAPPFIFHRFILMTTEQQVNTLLTANRFGGLFMRRLAVAGLVADPVNRALIFQHWPKLAQDYGPTSCLYSEDLG